jgi:ribosomal protein S18 acetylase RimI-like enzyme
MGVGTRVATREDDRALAVLDAHAWPRELWVVPPQPASQPFFGNLRAPEDVIVATIDGVVVGYARLGRHMSIPANDHVLHLAALAVSPDARGSGVGALLLEAAIHEAHRRGARKLGLRVVSTNSGAIRLYKRHGFHEEARLKDEIRLPDGSLADDVWFARALV